MKIFRGYIQVLSLICIITIIALGIHVFLCSDIHNLKIAISSVSKNYNFFKIVFPILYVLIAMNIFLYYISPDTSQNIYLIFALYFIILITTLLSTLLILKYANFIFSFWCIVFCIFLNSIFIYNIYKHSPKFLYLSSISNIIYIYLAIVTFWFYFKSTKI